MGLLNKLYEVYENCNQLNDFRPLHHVKIKSDFEIAINKDGEYVPNSLIEDIKYIYAPCTENSVSRSGKAVFPHPLFDQIGKVTECGDLHGVLNNEEYVECYLKNLSNWCQSEYKNEAVCIIYKYMQKRSMLADILSENRNIQLTPQSVIRIKVIEYDNPVDVKPWEDETVIRSWIDYYTSIQTNNIGLCYISGNKERLVNTCPKVIGNAKLISSEEGAFIRYSGDRFADSQDAFSLGVQSSEKIHAALSWVMKNGKSFVKEGAVTYVAFSATGNELPPLSEYNEDDLYSEADVDIETGEVINLDLARSLSKYKERIQKNESVVICGFEYVTPGRLSVVYYTEMRGEDFVQRINAWNKTCAIEGAKKDFVPYPVGIAKCALGLRNASQSSEKQFQSIVQRIVPCISEGRRIPVDIVRSVCRNASNLTNLENTKKRNYMLNVACAVIRKYHNDMSSEREMWKMSLDKKCYDKDYLFGRLLAYADRIESVVLYSKKSNRETTAMKKMLYYTKRPVSGWRQIFEKLLVYSNEPIYKKYRKDIDEVLSTININEFIERPLKDVYLLGYSHQMHAFRNEKNMDDELEDENN